MGEEKRGNFTERDLRSLLGPPTPLLVRLGGLAIAAPARYYTAQLHTLELPQWQGKPKPPPRLKPPRVAKTLVYLRLPRRNSQRKRVVSQMPTPTPTPTANKLLAKSAPQSPSPTNPKARSRGSSDASTHLLERSLRLSDRRRLSPKKTGS